MRKLILNRRTVLRGALGGVGIAVGLPPLEAMSVGTPVVVAAFLLVAWPGAAHAQSPLATVRLRFEGLPRGRA